MADDSKQSAQAQGAAPEVAVPSGGFWKSILEIFTDPFKVFARIDAGLSWWKPFIVTAAGSAVLTYLMLPFQARVRELLTQGLSGEQLAQAMERSAKFGRFSAFFFPVLLILSYLLISAVLHGMTSLMTSRGKYWKTASLAIFCALIPFVEMVIKTGILRARGIASIESVRDLMMSFGLSAVIPTESVALDALFESLSIFQIWYYVVLILGLAAIYKMSRKQALVATVPVWVLKYLWFIMQSFSIKMGGGR